MTDSYITKKLFFIGAVMVLLGAGCAKAGPVAREAAKDDGKYEQVCKVLHRRDGSPVFTAADAVAVFGGTWDEPVFPFKTEKDANFYGGCELKIVRPDEWKEGETYSLKFISYITRQWEYEKKLKTEKPQAYRDVPGLGDEAFEEAGGEAIYARKGNRYMQFVCIQDCGAEKRSSIMRTILDRLP